MAAEDLKVTTSLLFQCSAVVALLDGIFLFGLNKLIKPELFLKLKWVLILWTGLVWSGIWWMVLFYFWESVYHFVFPPWSRAWLPIGFALLMAGASLLFWNVAKSNTRRPIQIFCLLGGAWGICTHTWAIYRGIMTKPPMLQGASPWAALIFAFFEYIFYWCIIVSLAALTGRIAGLITKKLLPN